MASLDQHARGGAGGEGAIKREAGAEEAGMAAGEEQGDPQTFVRHPVAVGVGSSVDESV